MNDMGKRYNMEEYEKDGIVYKLGDVVTIEYENDKTLGVIESLHEIIGTNNTFVGVRDRKNRSLGFSNRDLNERIHKWNNNSEKIDSNEEEFITKVRNNTVFDETTESRILNCLDYADGKNFEIIRNYLSNELSYPVSREKLKSLLEDMEHRKIVEHDRNHWKIS